MSLPMLAIRTPGRPDRTLPALPGASDERSNSLLLNNGNECHAVPTNAVFWKPPESLPGTNCRRAGRLFLLIPPTPGARFPHQSWEVTISNSLLLLYAPD